MTPQPLDLSRPHRQSPLAVVFLALRTLRQVGLAQLVLLFLFLSRAPAGILVLVVSTIGLAFLAFGTVAWWRFTFWVEDDELRVTRGVLSEDRLNVPLDRIQSVSLEQQFLHRLVGLVQVSVDTAGTSEAEFTIDAVERRVAESLARVAAERRPESREEGLGGHAPPPPPAPEQVILRRDLTRLLKAGVARPAFAGLAVVFPLLAVADDLAGAVPVDVPTVDSPEPSLWMLWLLPVLLSAAVVVGMLLNLVQVVLTEWNLVLVERERGFRREAGLISRTSRATNIDRIQWLSVAENPVERRLGIQRVTLPTIGEGDLALPGTDADELATIRSLVIDHDAQVETLDRRISPAAVFLATRNAAITATIGATALWFAVGWWSLLAFALVPWHYGTSRRSTRLFRWGLSEHGIARRREFVTARRRELMLRKINAVTVRQRLFERSRGLATVVLHTAHGSVPIGMVPVAEARAVRDLVLARVETDRRAWM